MAAREHHNNRDRDESHDHDDRYERERDKERERRDLLLLLLILLLGFVCLLATAQMAVRMDRMWQVSADMFSEVKPEEEYAIDAGEVRVEPLRPEAGTPWNPNLFLTPEGTIVIVPPATFAPIPTATSTPQEVAGGPTPSPGASATPRSPTSTPTPTPTHAPTTTPTPSPTPTATPTTPTPTPTPTYTPSSTPTPIIPTPVPPTDTPIPPTPTYTPTPVPPTDTPLPPTPTYTPVPPTPTYTPVPHPSVLSITPDRGVNTAPVPVVITGADFIPAPTLPTARLGTGISIAISAATTDTLTGTVPTGITPGIYALTVQNPDGQPSTPPPWVYYTALNPSSPDTTLETGYLSTFGPDASGAEGDDDHTQVIFFEVPASYTGTLYICVFDADTGGTVDDEWYGGSTTMTYTLRGGPGAYTGARSSHPNQTEVNAGTLLTQTVIGNDAAYDGNWNLAFGPYSASDGESVGSSVVFKLVVEGASGSDGNFYNAALSTGADPLSNPAPAGSRVFAYSWTLPLPPDSSPRPPLYPYVPAGTASFEQHNWDMEYSSGPVTMILHTPVRDIVVPGSGMSGDGGEATSSHSVGDGERGRTWTVTMEFAYPIWNDFTFWAVGDGADLAIFTHPTSAPPP